ncbi:MAG: YggS family pyridoxal phosphate-dependent enzyme [Candidatus Marinimicrobia bacterium]|nr:YggS family pyridoxal phosphate-dependent enzyme [Candidatus Neomarinimicrobiota bacterium]MCF7904422.1 YggS family pyridoxal phosphate-dependent enzyme [Candidatus Neomarinimicrobiota bacterium]
MGVSVFQDRLKQVNDQIALAAIRSGRDPEDITLVGVSKRKPIEDMQQAYEAGLRHFGENRAQEVRDKFPNFDPPGIVRHFIGHLQSNKVKYLPERVDMIHSVDSVKIANAIDSRFSAIEHKIPVLVEVNISGEENKEGVEPSAAEELCAYCADKPWLEFSGLMTIGPLTDDSSRIRYAFQEMRKLLGQVEALIQNDQHVLSMGMSGDFEIAIEEGATHIRVGTAIFGPRAY